VDAVADADDVRLEEVRTAKTAGGEQADSTWTITAFAASLGVSGSVSEALQDGAPVPAAGEFEFIQSLAGRPVDEIEAKLRAGRLVERVAGVLSRGAAELKTPLVATGAELNKKFAADAFKGEMGFGGTAEFYGGLEGIIGSPTRTVQVADIGADLCGAAHSRERRRAAPQATTNRSIVGRQIYFVPIDLVEDRARTRVVGVAALFCLYLFFGSYIIGDHGDPPYILTDKVTFASEMPYYASLGGNITRTGAASVAIQVLGSDGNAFVERRCPALGSRCDNDASAKEPVIVTASVVKITHPIAPTNAPHCGNQPNEDCQINKGSMPCKMIETACTPKLEGEVVATDETGTATFSSLAIRSGPAATYLLRFDGADGVSTDSLISVAPRVSVIMPQDSELVCFSCLATETN